MSDVLMFLLIILLVIVNIIGVILIIQGIILGRKSDKLNKDLQDINERYKRL